MYFQVKNILKNNCNHTPKITLSYVFLSGYVLVL